MNKEIEIPFGAKDSELKGWEYTIPENMEAEIKDGKIIVKPKESEDERIREWLIEMVEELRKANPTNAEHNGNCSEAIAYLEKQKDILGERAKNITANMLEDRIKGIQRELIEFLSNTVNASWVDVIQSADAYAERIRNILEKQKEQKPESCDCSRDEESYMNGIHHVLMNPEAYGLIKQKPASISYNHENDSKPAEWSEEDKHCIHQLILFCENCMQQDSEAIRCATWLKSLRPQPKQEWSEEDENIYNKALDAIYYKDCNEKDDVISALNDLCDLISRKRKVIPPYAHWKPSKEQMEALKDVIETVPMTCRQQVPLESLYNDLLKLANDCINTYHRTFIQEL